MGPAGNVLAYGLDHARFADAGLARQQNCLALAAFCQAPSFEQKLPFRFPAHETGQPKAMARLEPAIHGCFTDHLPGGHGGIEAL